MLHRLSNLALVCSGIFAAWFVACAGQGDDRLPLTQTADSGVQVDQLLPIPGVSDRGRDPAIVAVDIAGKPMCTGVAIGTDAVLVPRHCFLLSGHKCEEKSPLLAASHAQVLVGEDTDTLARGPRGLVVLEPESSRCDADVAVLIVEKPIAGVKPVAVRAHGIAKGDVVRTIAFAEVAVGWYQKILREYVPILDSDEQAFKALEPACLIGDGGIALDVATGEVVGVFSHLGPSCDGLDVHNVYSRADIFLPLIDAAYRWRGAGGVVVEDADGGSYSAVRDAGTKPTTTNKPESDVGGACITAADCAAGVCVATGSQRYCSRQCGAGKKCPTGYSCTSFGEKSFCLVK